MTDLQQIRRKMHILGIDTDNGGELINEVLIAYCESRTPDVDA